MTPERWKVLEALFHQASGLQGEARAVFLAKACGDDAQLRTRLERLLAAHDRETSFLDSPILEAGGTDPDGLEISPGVSLGAYIVIGELGRGGMGVVFLARDRLERRVAVKILSPSFVANRDLVQRFQREAKAISALKHPNILTIYEVGQADGVHFIATEFVDGVTLRQRLEQGRMSVAETLDISTQVVEALSAAHGAGIVHRDIKPENLMVRPDGVAKILDFGLAKLTQRSSAAELPGDPSSLSERSASTLPGMVMGTVSYMSPEQARGLKVDHRTDIFSLGVTMYEMVTGIRPFQGGTASDVMAAILHDEPAPVSRLRNVPLQMDRVIGRALGKDCGDRYQNAAEFGTDLKLLKQELEKPGHAISSPLSAPSGASSPLPAAAGQPSGAGNARHRLARLGKPGRWAATAGVLVVVLAALAYLNSSREPSPVSPSDIKSLAVLPLTLLSPQAGDEYLGLAIADAIITRTSQMGAVVVRPVGAVRQFGDRKTDPLEAARELQVDAVLQGTVQRAGGHLRVSMNLLRTRDGASLWAGSIDRKISEGFALQDAISHDVARALKVTLGGGQQQNIGRWSTRNGEAYDYYLRGRFYLTRSDRKEDHITAIGMLERATRLDPAFALAHVSLAAASAAVNFSHDADSRYNEKAFVALEKALAVDPNIPDAYYIRGNVLWTLAHGFPHRRAIAEFRRALSIDPNLAGAHRDLGGIYSHLGLFDKALDELQTAAMLDPSDFRVPPRMARIHSHQQKNELALQEFEKISPPWYREQAIALWHLGRVKEAMAFLERVLKNPPASFSSTSISDCASAYAVLLAGTGRHAEAEQYIRLSQEKGDGTSHFHHSEYYIGCAYALMGKNSLALEWLRRTAEHGMPCYPLFEKDPNLDGLRTDPGFVVFMNLLKQQWESLKREFG